MNEYMPSIPGPRGYYSEQDKRRYTLKAGILGAVFILAHFVIPFVFMLPLMFGVMCRTMTSPRMQADRVAWWRQRVWAVTTSGEFGDGGGLVSIKVGEDDEPVEVCRLPEEDARLLPDGDRLWVISSAGVHCYEDGRIAHLSRTALGGISRPFLYEGRPAVVEMQPTEDALKVFDDGQWRTVRRLDMRGDDAPCLWPGNLRIIPDGSVLHVFLMDKGTIYYRRGLPSADETDEADADSWTPVGGAGGCEWAALLLDGRPAVLQINRGEFDATVVGRRLRDGRWRRFFRHKTNQLAADISAFALPGEDHFMLVLGGDFGSLSVFEVRDGAAGKASRYGSNFPFPAGFMAIMFVPYAANFLLTAIFAIVISAQMRRHRVCEYAFGALVVPFASLARRAAAQIIDAVIEGAPMAVAFILLFRNLEFMFDPLRVLFYFGLMVVGFLWAVVLLFVFSFLEGRYGRTPGKWVAGIRVVGTDLRPCGFGRAIVRNLLKCVDGLFHFMVGIMIAALTENWQRIGDLAGRTIVIRGRPGEAK